MLYLTCKERNAATWEGEREEGPDKGEGATGEGGGREGERAGGADLWWAGIDLGGGEWRCEALWCLGEGAGGEA